MPFRIDVPKNFLNLFAKILDYKLTPLKILIIEVIVVSISPIITIQ